MPRGTVYDAISRTCFDTPLVHLRRLFRGSPARVLLKLEFMNPLSSVKDRIALAMIEDAERAGRLRPGGRVVEPTSGNTGIALAFICAERGYPLSLVMPESMSMERRVLLRGMGAEVILTPAALGMPGAVSRATDLLAEDPAAFMPQQFDNPANPRIHEETTGPEIWTDTGGSADMLVAGVGTGGTITGVTRFIRRHHAAFRAIAVEPAASAVLSGGAAAPHRIQGIGAGFIPANLDRTLLSGVETVTNEEAFEWARRLAATEGIPAGISTGANLAAAARLAHDPAHAGLTIVTIACSPAERYLSTQLFDGLWY